MRGRSALFHGHDHRDPLCRSRYASVPLLLPCRHLTEKIFAFLVPPDISGLDERVMLEEEQPLFFKCPIQHPALRLQCLNGVEVVAHDVWERKMGDRRDEITEEERHLTF